jgi:hypothetical protein
MEGVMDGLSQEEYELSDEVVLFCCWCGGEKRKSLMVLDYRPNIGRPFCSVVVICVQDDRSLC